MAANSTPNIRVLSDIELEELFAKKELKRSMLPRLFPLLAEVRVLVITSIILEILLVCFIFLRPLFIQKAIDDGLIMESVNTVKHVVGVNWPQVYLAIAGLAITWGCRFFVAGCSQYTSGTAAIRVLNHLRVRVFRHVQHLSVSYFDRTKSGRIITRIDRDIDALEPLLIQGPPEILSAILRLVMATLLLYFISPLLLLGLFSVLPLMAISSWLFRRLSQNHYASVAENRSKFTTHLIESVAGVRVIKQTAQEDFNRKKYRRLVDDFIQSLVDSNIASGWFTHFTGVVTVTGLMVLLVTAGYELNLGHISLGQFAACLFYVYMFLGPIQELGDLVERYTNGVASAQRVFLLLDTKSEIVEADEPIELEHVRGEVEFKNVNFSYDDKNSKPVIQDLNLHVQPGEMLAIVGATGHGKSTIVQLLSRFYDVSSGQILLDGVDIRRYSQSNLRKHVGMVLQENVLFSGTIYDNLKLANPDGSLESFRASAKSLSVDDLIMRLPHGYETEVGPLGDQLSHGQRQLICLLRAYIANPDLLILDEATSAIDIQTEHRIQHALKQLCTGRTAIVIAHRLATIRDATKIAVIENGRIGEIGTHEQLISSESTYAKLYSAYEQGQQI